MRSANPVRTTYIVVTDSDGRVYTTNPRDSEAASHTVVRLYNSDPSPRELKAIARVLTIVFH